MDKEAGRPVRLTKRMIDDVAHRDKPFIVWDADLKGFGLWVAAKPSRMKTFVAKYRVGGGRREHSASTRSAPTAL